MSDRTTSCPRCGAALPPRVAPEACPSCLLRMGLDADPAETSAGHGAPEAPAPEELAAGFPQLEIGELLGRGGMGAVYRARQSGLDRDIALKILLVDPEHADNFAERFAREARALASLNHPNIVGVYDFGRAGEHYYLTMEYVDGVNLREMLRASDIHPRQALEIVGQICDALQYAHDEGIVHRDIKPENILVDRRGRVKIADFGLAKLLQQRDGTRHLTGTFQAMGTPHYMAPEQVERPLEVDHRADIYSLGVVFYELLTGELPIGRFEAPSERVQVDVRLDDVVLKALDKEPARRYQAASHVRTAVHSISSRGPEPESASSWASSLADDIDQATRAASEAASAASGATENRDKDSFMVSRSFGAWGCVGCLAVPLALILAAGIFAVLVAPMAGVRVSEATQPGEITTVLALPDSPIPADVTEAHTRVCERIRAASKLKVTDESLARFELMARDEVLTDHEQQHLIAAVLALPGVVQRQAGVLIVLIRNQEISTETRSQLISKVSSLPHVDSQVRVLDALKDTLPDNDPESDPESESN